MVKKLSCTFGFENWHRIKQYIELSGDIIINIMHIEI